MTIHAHIITKWTGQVKSMIWEGEPAEKTVERLRALGVDSIVFDPSANRPSSGDFLTTMTENARSLRLVFGPVSGNP
jgi:zinc transport system substrate-binding protein